ncbi:Carbonyl reductase NADPH 1 [Porphyridium purpureum]|uniref:Carbonyl reductase NADPH 1 n=1 Tax=Porphyridium purpureum TaxID=35688 RepID=A0A5J4YUK0_PORPP|nr:Carbonyl reductase NADPH 1 [Porphyridium purpureum]|eukprot:POR8962..scf227_4
MLTSMPLSVVTGGNAGIGFEIARALAGHTHCVLTARDEARGRAAVKSLLDDAARQNKTLALEFAQLDIGDSQSIKRFASWLESKGEMPVDVLVNNAGMAFKQADPTPFEAQTVPTLATNYFGTLAVTEALLPLLNKQNGRLVFVASQAGLSAFHQCSPEIQARWKLAASRDSSDEVTALVNEYIECVRTGGSGALRERGWCLTNYGVSKLAVTALAKTYAKRGISSTSCCPGYVSTAMTSFRGAKTPEAGSKTPVALALSADAPRDGFFRDGLADATYL